MKVQKGYTLFDLMFVLSALASLAVLVATVYLIAHFAAKFW